MGFDGGTAKQLTDFPGFDNKVDWSPDGLEIAFSSQGPQGEGVQTLWVLSRDSVGGTWGEEPVQLTGFRCGWPDWSPDGSTILCGDGRVIFLIPRHGGEERRIPLVAGLTRYQPPKYARDGSRIYFIGYHEDGTTGVWSISISGDEVSRLVDFDDPSLTTFNLLTVGRNNFLLTFSEYESDIWVADLEY